MSNSNDQKCVVLYDFDCEPNSGEMSVSVGQTLIVTRTDIGDGWYQGTNPETGQSGLFPAAYVDMIKNTGAETSVACNIPNAPQAPSTNFLLDGNEITGQGAPGVAGGWNTSNHIGVGGGWSNASNAMPTNINNDNKATIQGVKNATNKESISQPHHYNVAYDDAEDIDDDYDDDDSDFDDYQVSPSVAGGGNPSQHQRDSFFSSSNNDIRGSNGNVSASTQLSNNSTSSTTVKTQSFSRFSAFVKTGADSYMTGKNKVDVPKDNKFVIKISKIQDPGCLSPIFCWVNTEPPYSCSIQSYRKESKLGGLKNFIAYKLTPSFNNIQVSRRYKHFDWLHERLSSKFACCIAIPPLPDKQIQGRYEDDFIEHRMVQLQSFVDRICRHPVLSRCETWLHFITCTSDDVKRWKLGKRKAERDVIVGASIFNTIQLLENNNVMLDRGAVDSQLQVITQNYTNNLHLVVKATSKMCFDQRALRILMKREFNSVNKCFTGLSSAMSVGVVGLDESGGGKVVNSLTNAISSMGYAFEEIGKMYEENLDFVELSDLMHDYHGLLSCWPTMLNVNSGCISRRKEFEKLNGERKVEQNEVYDVQVKSDLVSISLLAELNTFNKQRDKDLTLTCKKFLQNQICFYKNVVEKLEDALRNFDSC